MSGIYTIPTQNALQSTLDAELAAGGTSMTLADDWSSYFSGVSANNPAILVIDRQDANGTDIPSKREYVKVTNVSGATFTIGTRGMNGSTDQVHSVGARVECVTDVETWKSIKDTFEVEHSSTDGTHDFSSSNVDFQGISLGAGTTMTAVLDEDNMASDSATALATQQSIKAYVDAATPNGIKVLLTPLSAIFPASNYPQLVKNAGTNKTDFTLDYDASTDETAEWEIPIPNGLTINSATLYLTFRMASATSGAVVWASITQSGAEGEAWDTAGTTDTFTAETVQDTAGKISVVSKALTTTGWAADETLHIKISRDADNGSDTATGDAKLISALLVIA